MQTALTIFADDAIAAATLHLAAPRLADLLHSDERIRTTSVAVRALADGHQLHLDQLDLERREILLAVPDDVRGDVSRRIATQAQTAHVRIGPFDVLGDIHAPARMDPFALAKRRAWVAMTNVTVRWQSMGRERLLTYPVVLVNASRIADLRPAGNQFRDLRGMMVTSDWVADRHPRPVYS